MAYRDPGKLFIKRGGSIATSDDVFRYVDFLRRESGLSIEPPIDLSVLYHCFDIPTPVRAPIPNSGLLVNPDTGLILVNEEDLATRQRFTECHEIVELLFAALPIGRGWAKRQAGGFSQSEKERLCNMGAAEILMPKASIASRLMQQGISFETARRLAAEFNVSLTAALVQTVRVGVGRHAIVLWRLKNKPDELRAAAARENQLSLFDGKADRLSAPKLRVEWSISGKGTPYIPPHKSVSQESSVFRAWESGEFTAATEVLDICRNVVGAITVENQPFQLEGERQVLSLLHFPGALGCNKPLEIKM